jgi:hypothetical protein
MIHTTGRQNYQPTLPLHDVTVRDVTQTFGGTHRNTWAGIFVYESRNQVLQVTNTRTCHYLTSYAEYQPDGNEFGTIMKSEPYISYMRSSTTGDCPTGHWDLKRANRALCTLRSHIGPGQVQIHLCLTSALDGDEW